MDLVNAEGEFLGANAADERGYEVTEEFRLAILPYFGKQSEGGIPVIGTHLRRLFLPVVLIILYYSQTIDPQVLEIEESGCRYCILKCSWQLGNFNTAQSFLKGCFGSGEWNRCSPTVA
jgi:hypothetical protein